MTSEETREEQPSVETELPTTSESQEAPRSLPPLEEVGDLAAWAENIEEEIPPGTTGDETVRPRRYGLVAIIILGLLAAVVTVVGVFERHGRTSILSRVSFSGPPKTEIVDARDGIVLMLETQGNFRRVIVQTPDQASWQLVSKDDTTATNPALSPDGRFVAYVSAREDGQIVIVSLVDDALTRITPEEVKDIADKTPFSAAKVCSWTFVAWHPDEHRIAFFGCREKPALSVVYVADLSGPEPVLSFVTSSDVDSSAPRQLQWSGPSEVTVTGSSDDARSGDNVKTLSVP